MSDYLQIDLFTYMEELLEHQSKPVAVSLEDMKESQLEPMILTTNEQKEEPVTAITVEKRNVLFLKKNKMGVWIKSMFRGALSFFRTSITKPASSKFIRWTQDQAILVKQRRIVIQDRIRRHLKQEFAEFKMGLREWNASSGGVSGSPSTPHTNILDYLSTMMGLAPWINVYKVTRAYGGPEQGGWFYRKYTCEKSIRVWRWNAEAAAAMYLRTYEKLSWGLLCSESAGLEISVKIEMKAGQLQHNARPAFHPDIIIKTDLKPVQKTEQPGSHLKTVRSNSVKLVSLHLVRAAREEEEPCERCEGKGRTHFTHIQNGICFLCGGSGKKTEESKNAGETLRVGF